MKRFLAPTLAALALAACSESSQSPLAPTTPEQLAAPLAPYHSKGSSGIEGDYIVVFKDAVANPLAKGDEKILKHSGQAKFRYDQALKGFAATLSPGAVALLQADPDVAYIEQDQTVSVS